MDINEVVLTGRIVTDVHYLFDEAERLPPQTSFSIVAVDRFNAKNKPAKTLIDVLLVEKEAIRAKNMLKKGSVCMLYGSLRQVKIRKGNVTVGQRPELFVAARHFKAIPAAG